MASQVQIVSYRLLLVREGCKMLLAHFLSHWDNPKSPPPPPRPIVCRIRVLICASIFVVDPTQIFPPGQVLEPKVYAGTIMISLAT